MKIRNALRQFKPYQWEPSTREIARSVGIQSNKIIRMDANTSPFLPTSSLRALAPRIASFPVNEYPDTSYHDLSKELARYTGKKQESLVVTNGADEALDIISKVFLDPSDEAIIPYPTYSMFRIVTEIRGATPRLVGRNPDLSLDAEAIKQQITSKTRVIFLCSPNNPTGDTISEETAKYILRSTDALVVIDEAYYEFCGKTLADLTHKYDNVAIVRTFSKAFSMAGVRVGYIIASQRTVESLNLVRPPNSLSVISLALAQAALKDKKLMEQNVRSIMREKKRCAETMSGLNGIEVHPGDGNFILFRVKRASAKSLNQRLLKKGIVLRDLSDVKGLEGCLRVTISTQKNNDLFLRGLKSALS
ncbi:MAG: histidinol-phosphate transaminase [Nitrososphaerota archaeon]|nr:histidinol-phosphate transaminase [Nitrososphaerota archaeon]